jgi:class 3 adenylate cyclase
MQSLAKLMEDAVSEQGGVVQGFTGDGVMAVFGAPVALIADRAGQNYGNAEKLKTIQLLTKG